MWTMGSPFDAPHPRFQQAAAHLSSSIGSNAKKPPLSPSLPVDGERSLPKSKETDFLSSPSLEHSASLSNISRRRSSTCARSEFPPTHSLPFMQMTGDLEKSANSEAALLMPSSSACEPQQPPQPLPTTSSLLLPQPTCHRFLPRNLPSLLAITGTMALLVMSVVILWPPSGAGSQSQPLQQPPPLNLPRKFFDRIFNGAAQPQQMEHFTAAQGAGWGTGFGLEDASQPGMEVIPSDDFTNFVAAHLGWEDEDPVSDTVAEARFEAAEAMNDHLPRAGGFGEGLVTIDAKGVDHMAHAISAAVTTTAKTGKTGGETGSDAAKSGDVPLEGRKELETGTVAAAGTTAANPATASANVIPQEQVNKGNALANSNGVADPLNLLDSDSTTPVSGNSKPRIAVQPGVTGGTNGNSQMSSTSGTTNQMTGSFASTATGTTTTATNKPTIAVQPTTGGGTNTNSQMTGGTTVTSAGTMGATQVVGTKPAGSTVGSSGSSTSGTTASSLRTSSGKTTGSGASSHSAAGTGTVGTNTPLESMAVGQVSGVVQTDLSGGSSSAGGTFKPLAG